MKTLNIGVNGLVNIWKGIKVKNINVYESVNLDEQQHQTFKASWPDGFYNVIKNEVRTIKI